MKTLAAVLALWTLTLAAEPGTERPARLKEVGSITGRSFLAIQAAVPELARFGVKVDDHRIVVVDAGASVVVLFEDPETTVFHRGSTERMPGIEVELSREGLRVIGSRVSK